MYSNNIRLLQFLLSDQNLIIDQKGLRQDLILLTGYNASLYPGGNCDNVDKHKRILLCLANCNLITVPILFMAVEYNWYTILPDLLKIPHQLQQLNQPDEGGKYMLDYACNMVTRKNGVDTIKTLLLAGAVNSNDVVENIQRDKSGCWSDKVIKLITSSQDTRDEWLLQQDIPL